MELVFHTIPTFGHAHVISEIPFETDHQTLEQSMTRKPHTDKHINGAYHTSCNYWCNDWKRRIIQLLEIISTSTDSETLNMKKLLALLLIGNDAKHLRKNADRENQIVEQVFSNI